MREHKIQVHKKDGSKEEKNYIIIQFFAVYFAATVFWCAILSVFPFEIEPAFVYVSQLLPVAVWMAVLGNKKRSMLLSVMTLAMSVALIAVFRKEIYQGGSYMANQYITLLNKFYVSNQPLIEGGESGMALMLSIVAIQMLVAAVFAAVLVKRKMAAVAVMLFVIPLVLAATVGHMPSIFAVWSMLGAGIFYFIVYREQKTGNAMKGSLAAIGAFSGMVIIATIVQPAILEVKEKYKEEYAEINKALIKSQNMDLVDSVLSSLGGNANYAVGGIGKGDLRNLAQNRPRGSRDMEIILSQKPLEPIYLKAFVGAKYTGTMWERPPKKDFMKMLDKTGISDGQRTVMGEPYRQVKASGYPPELLQMEIILKAAQDEFAYAPYYAEIDQGDSIYADAYIEGKGRKNRTYDFYPRGRSEALEAEELPRNYQGIRRCGVIM